ncbi:MAG: cytochrome b562 [Lentisphaeraceae bacterium]|nr:cytochrome b562 [Lentisphaeraceae bacterium]
MYKLLLIAITLFVAGCATEIPYEGKDHPFRVAMRDMKGPYKTLENFEKDAKLAPDAAKAAQELKALCVSTSKMKPAFLNAEQHSAYNKHFSDMVAAIDAHEGAFKSGDVKKAQGLYGALAKVKKAAHGEFVKQAKKHRGAE